MDLLPRLMLVTDRRRLGVHRLLDSVVAALKAGPAVVQIRENDLQDEAVAELVRRIAQRTAGQGLVVINGRPDVAIKVGAGLHLPASQATLLSTAPVCRPLGCSIHDAAETAVALTLEPDYLVAGTIFPTASKPGVSGCGIGGLQQLVAGCGRRPVYAIGGMEPHQIPAVLGTGAYGVAVSGAVLGAEDPGGSARRFLEALGERGTLSS